MNWTSTQVREVTDDLFEKARAIKIGGDNVRPMLFFFLAGPGKGKPQLVVYQDQYEDKDEHRAHIDTLCAKLHPQFVARVGEAYSLSGKDVAPENARDELVAAQAWMQAGKSLEDFPGRREVIHMSVDGAGFSLQYLAEILPTGGLAPTEVEDCKGLNAEGRFVNLSGRLGED